MKAIAKYPGSKWSLAGWIISFFPEHHSYVEPFFGTGAVLFNKQRSHIETVNDLDGNVVNLFECIRSDPEKLARSIYLTPYARDVYEKAFKENPEDPFERALNFYIRLNMGHGFRTTGEKVGWKNDVQGRERVYILRDLGFNPYVMLYNKDSIPQGHKLRQLQRWVNNRIIFRSCSRFEDFNRKDKKEGM